jgi:competence protein ComEC
MVLVWLYVASLGFPAPATRAAAFLSTLGVARARQRHPPPGAVLAVALLLVMAIDPAAVTSVGAWLSALAVWGTRAGAEALGKFRLLGASLGATVATAPITAFAFGTVAPVGVVANLAAVPLAGLAVPGLFLSLFAGDFVAAGTGFVFALIERVAMLGAAVPGGNIVGIPGVVFAAPWFGIFCVTVWLHVSRPSWVLVRRRLVGAAVLACWIVVAVSLTSRPDSSRDLLVHILSVGQGDAIAIRTPRGRWALIDGGPRTAGFDAGRNIVLPFFRRQRASRLAAVVVTHGDADHLGGIPAVVEQLEPEIVLDPGQPRGTDLYLEYLRSIDIAGSAWRPARAGDAFVIDSVLFEVLHPSADWFARQLEPNENSVVLRLTYGCLTALFTGDIGSPVESELAASVGEAALLKVAHHGSDGSTNQAWLRAVRPRLAVISVGPNRFGHPAPELLSRLADAEVPVFRTDQGGTVTIRSDGSYLESVQGEAINLSEKLLWLIQPWLRSSGSSSNGKRSIRRQRVSLPDCSSR